MEFVIEVNKYTLEVTYKSGPILHHNVKKDADGSANKYTTWAVSTCCLLSLLHMYWLVNTTVASTT